MSTCFLPWPEQTPNLPSGSGQSVNSFPKLPRLLGIQPLPVPSIIPCHLTPTTSFIHSFIHPRTLTTCCAVLGTKDPTVTEPGQAPAFWGPAAQTRPSASLFPGAVRLASPPPCTVLPLAGYAPLSSDNLSPPRGLLALLVKGPLSLLGAPWSPETAPLSYMLFSLQFP